MSSKENDDCFDDKEFLDYYTKKKLVQSLKLQVFEDEEELIKLTTEKTMIVHFFMPSYSTCRILNNALQAISTKFKKEGKVDCIIGCIDVKNCPKMVNSLNINTLPFLAIFKNGYFIEELVGFEKLENSGKTGNLKTDELEKFIVEAISKEVS